MLFADVCTNSTILKIIYFISSLINIIFLVIPIILIIMICVDFCKNVIASGEDDMKKNTNVAIKRIIMAVAMFFVPTIVNIAIGLLDDADIQYMNCFTNATLENIEFYELAEEQSHEEELANRVKNVVPDIPTKPAYTGQGNSSVNVYFLNVGSADCMIIENNKKFGLIDTSYQNGEDIVEILEDLGAKKLEFVIITHAHIDHIGGYNEISDEFEIKNLYIKKAGLGKHGGYKRVITKAQKDGTKINNVSETTIQDFKMGSIEFEFYNKGFNVYSDMSRGDNANSIATLANINGVEVYFAGDIGDYWGDTNETDTAKEIGQVDVYKAAHHGYTSFNNSEEVINTLAPKYTIFSISKEDKSKINPAITRIKNNVNYIKEYYTEDGTILMNISSSGKITFTQD